MKRPYLAALLGGATISLVPTWLVAQLVTRFPNLAPEELEVVADFFGKGIGPLQYLVFMIIVFLLPVIEEYLFRGLLWKLFKWKLSDNLTWILTSLIFAMAHFEPLHVMGLLPFSFFLGWLRKKTGSIEVPILAHMTNNLVACAFMVL